MKELEHLEGLTEIPICEALADLAAGVPSDQAIVEIGVFKAKTACYLAAGASTGPGAHVWGVDPWDLPGDRYSDRPYFTRPTTRRSARQTVAAMGFSDRITLIREFSTALAKEWTGPKVGMLFVDGDHSYDGCRDDVDAWIPHLANGAVIAFDDYGNPRCPDVKRAVGDLITEGVLDLEYVVDDWLAVTGLASR